MVCEQIRPGYFTSEELKELEMGRKSRQILIELAFVVPYIPTYTYTHI